MVSAVFCAPQLRASSLPTSHHVCFAAYVSCTPTMGLSLLTNTWTLFQIRITSMLTQSATSVSPFTPPPAVQGLFKMESALRKLYFIVLIKYVVFIRPEQI